MITYIGNALGVIKQLDWDDNAYPSTSTIKMKVSLDVQKALRRVVQIRSPFDEEYTICFTCARLPNFCFFLRKKWGTLQGFVSTPSEASPEYYPRQFTFGTIPRQTTNSENGWTTWSGYFGTFGMKGNNKESPIEGSNPSQDSPIFPSITDTDTQQTRGGFPVNDTAINMGSSSKSSNLPYKHMETHSSQVVNIFPAENNTQDRSG
ncbi:hypothetical protein Salat_1551000 [Sesamum alatum]|uniref:Uncharacterized protein n=1 Tax=Sesamum alatum TaxID=300844 RepID=A0AAE2CMQ2_9LAMI|nr:hypothetical protein Salat_1551000 [Sesamum alatum]